MQNFEELIIIGFEAESGDDHLQGIAGTLLTEKIIGHAVL